MTVPRRCFFCGSFLLFMFVVFSCLYIVALWSPAGKGQTSCVWCVILYLLLSHVVTWVMCGAWLYRFLIFAFFLTFNLHLTQLSLASILWDIDKQCKTRSDDAAKRLIRLSTVCKKRFLLKFEKNEHNPKIVNGLVQLIRMGKYIRHRWVHLHLIVLNFLLSCLCLCDLMHLPHGAMGWSVICECGIFWSYSFALLIIP